MILYFFRTDGSLPCIVGADWRDDAHLLLEKQKSAVR